MPWINGQSSATRIANGAGLIVVNADGSVSVTPASGTGLTLGVAPPATNRYALMQIGSGPVDGTSAGHYTGSASGGGYGANFASGYAGDGIRLQVAGVDGFVVSSTGNVTMKTGSSIFGPNRRVELQINDDGIVAISNRVTNTGFIITGASGQTADLLNVRDSAVHQQFGVMNAGSGAAPVWALRVRAVANAESMAQAHVAGAATGRAIQIIDDAGVSLGWLNLTA